MSFTLNDTSLYYRNEIDTLGWELTTCNLLEESNSACRRFMRNSNTFGNLLFNYLCKYINISEYMRIMEIGGGYGYLMRDFLTHRPELKPIMLDISPYLLARQKDTLKAFNVSYIEDDLFNIGPEILQSIDMAVLNEIAGDFYTACNVNMNYLAADNGEISNNVLGLIDKYSLSVPLDRDFNFNFGAIRAIEMLCHTGIEYIYMSEHSCEASPPVNIYRSVSLSSDGYPEKISLKGHNEYSINFSHLVKVASFYDYKIIRGNYTDFIKIEDSDALNIIITSTIQSDKNEIIRHFIDDLYIYEYLFLIKN